MNLSRLLLPVVLLSMLSVFASPGAWCAEVARSAPASATPDAPEEEDDEYAQPSVKDPLERYNRAMFKFNDRVMRLGLRPFIRGYERVVPARVRRGVVSFYDNVKMPVRLAACLLQGKADRASAEVSKFALNTTVGLGGWVKVSDHFAPLRVPEEDIGQALGSWGLPPGPFIVLPLLGPANPREIVGRVGDYVLSPTTWDRGSFVPERLEIMEGLSDEWQLTVSALDTVSSFPELLATYEALMNASVDPYVAFRNGFLQYREAAIRK